MEPGAARRFAHAWGVDALYERIDQAARAACRDMDMKYPISLGGDPP